jgi:hypothetical protein
MSDDTLNKAAAKSLATVDGGVVEAQLVHDTEEKSLVARPWQGRREQDRGTCSRAENATKLMGGACEALRLKVYLFVAAGKARCVSGISASSRPGAVASSRNRAAR